MCGIYAYLRKNGTKNDTIMDTEFRYFMNMKHRGPDSSFMGTIVPNRLFFGFHRLAINGLDMMSNQPMELDGYVLICNGEIFNHDELVHQHRLETKTKSDCEVILHLYALYGMDETIKMLDGEFAFVLYDRKKDELFVGRDHLGVRPLFYDETLGDCDRNIFASEAKAISVLPGVVSVKQFPPRTWWSSNSGYHVYYAFPETTQYYRYPERRLRYLLEEAVSKRVHNTDVEVGCLLSGGLDSSIVAAIAAQELAKHGKTIKTFCIGVEGSPDLEAASQVAKHIGSVHYSFLVEEKDIVDALDDTIYTIESNDVTTVRASIFHRLIAHKIRNSTNVKVLLSGETADELSGSYAYFANAPDDESFRRESLRLLREIHYFDGLRADRCVSSAGLELRVPFADKNFIDFYTTLNPTLLRQDLEKALLRNACSDLLPEFILKRRKNGFSDSATSSKRSVADMIREARGIKTYEEELELYNSIYRTYFTPGQIPHQWQPKWTEEKDPSARLLSTYQGD